MQDYRKLLVWQKAHRLVLDVYADSAAHLRLPAAWTIKDQMIRAAISIPSNIAEGAGRGSNPTFGVFSFTRWVRQTNLSMICFWLGTWRSFPGLFIAREPNRSRKFDECFPG